MAKETLKQRFKNRMKTKRAIQRNDLNQAVNRTRGMVTEFKKKGTLAEKFKRADDFTDKVANTFTLRKKKKPLDLFTKKGGK